MAPPLFFGIMDEMNPQNGRFPLELKEDVAQGVYSNLAVIAHSSSEFVVDFARVLPGVPKAVVQTRIILAPEHAKRLLFALSDNIRKYESVHGEIRVEGMVPGGGFPVQFGGTMGEA